MKNLILLLSGLVFGAGLALSGMTDPSRVIGFLDVTGKWDPTLAFVMGGALVVFGGGLFVLRIVRKGKGLFGCDLPPSESDPVSTKLLLGAACFGLGWGLAGFCPGPALANLGLFRLESLLFVPTMALGMALNRWTARR